MSPKFYPFELRASPISGIGLFTRRDIVRGEDLWKYVEADIVFERKVADMEFRNRFGVRDRRGWWIPSNPRAVSAWWYMNHSDDPNIDNARDEICVALCDIRTGEELTCDYRKLNDVPQTHYGPFI